MRIVWYIVMYGFFSVFFAMEKPKENLIKVGDLEALQDTYKKLEKEAELREKFIQEFKYNKRMEELQRDIERQKKEIDLNVERIENLNKALQRNSTTLKIDKLFSNDPLNPSVAQDIVTNVISLSKAAERIEESFVKVDNELLSVKEKIKTQVPLSMQRFYENNSQAREQFEHFMKVEFESASLYEQREQFRKLILVALWLTFVAQFRIAQALNFPAHIGFPIDKIKSIAKRFNIDAAFIFMLEALTAEFKEGAPNNLQNEHELKVDINLLEDQYQRVLQKINQFKPANIITLQKDYPEESDIVSSLPPNLSVFMNK